MPNTELEQDTHQEQPEEAMQLPTLSLRQLRKVHSFLEDFARPSAITKEVSLGLETLNMGAKCSRELDGWVQGLGPRVCRVDPKTYTVHIKMQQLENLIEDRRREDFGMDLRRNGHAVTGLFGNTKTRSRK